MPVATSPEVSKPWHTYQGALDAERVEEHDTNALLKTQDRWGIVAVSLTPCLMLPDAQMEEDFVKANPAWVEELEIMTRTKVKAEIQALSSFGFQYLSQVYLPLKLQEGDWI